MKSKKQYVYDYFLKFLQYKDCSSKFRSKHRSNRVLCQLRNLLEQSLEFLKFKIGTVKKECQCSRKKILFYILQAIFKGPQFERQIHQDKSKCKIKNLIYICLITNNTNLNMRSDFFALNSSTWVRIGNMKLVKYCQGLIRCSEVDRLPTRACELSSLPLLKIENDPFLRNYRATENESFIIWAVRAWKFGVPFVIRLFSCSTTIILLYAL